ncbi:NADase-type glycan-binding domain-containing protein [Streptomyces sp. NPDC018610]|uniref:NADase-type glycan-binding domain-containing protein n=1 Tax=Streptomyces sp. NPDC018610 TaxID=3365049 RepID=UPI0037887B57
MTTTQNCADCGTRAEPGQSFCDACGAVLSWTDRSASRTPAAATAAAPAGAGGPGGAGEPGGTGGPVGAPEASGTAGTRSGEPSAAGTPAGSPTGAAPASSAPAATGSGGALGAAAAGGAAAFRPDGGGTDPAGPARTAPTATGAPAPSAEPAVGPAAEPDPSAAADTLPQPAVAVSAPAASPAVDQTAPTAPLPAAPAAGETEGMTDRARQLLIPVSDPGPQAAAAPSVAPVLPGRPAPQRPQVVRAPGEELGADGGTPCPWCGTGNRPDRHYCARCAMPMAGGAQAPTRLPWWRRLTAAGNREAPWAGDRPRLRRAFDRVLAWLGVAVVLGLLIALVVNIPQGVQATRDHFAKRAPVAPDRVSASRSYPGHKPELAFDKLNNTWWGPGVSDSGQGQWVEARFDEPTRLLDLIITPGVSIRPDQLSKSALPHRVKALITLADGKTTTRELTLDQGAGGQRRSFRVGEVTAVRFVIESAYQTSGSKQVSIAEIEFFGPSNGS